jgi:lactate permease
MDILLFGISWTPVLFLTILAVFLKRSALELSIYGFLFTLILAFFVFNTPFMVVLIAGVDGVLTTLPLLFVVFCGILLSSLLMAMGSLNRIVEWFKGAVGDIFQRNILITLGVSNFLEGAGVIAEPIIAPMLHAAGVSSVGSAALSIIGYSGLMTLELAGIIITILSLVTGIPAQELGLASAWLSIPSVLLMALCVPIFLPKPAWQFRQVIVIVLSGLLLGMTALGAVAYIGVPISGILAGIALIAAFMLVGSRKLDLSKTILIDLSPFFLILVCLLLVNSVPFLRKLTFEKLVFSVNIIPVHTITFRPFYSAYLYLFGGFILAGFLLRVPGDQLKKILLLGTQKGWRAFIAMGLFGAMGQIISYTGYAPDFMQFDQAKNIPLIISHGLVLYTGELYPIFVPFLGWVGTFLTGYGVASLMLFGQLQVQAAGLLGVSATWLSAGLAVGASLGSISSPFKIALATPMCGAVGKEGAILRWTIPLGILSSLAIGLILALVIL